MQNQGSIGPATVAELLQAMQQERATGTLSLASNGNQCSLHFLFGHLFHAVGAVGEGEPAVIEVLGWHDGEYNFNPRAKLPPEETINSSTEDLLAQWRSGRETHPVAASRAEVKVAAAGSTSSARSEAGVGDVRGAEGEGWREGVHGTETAAVVEELNDIPAFQAPALPAPEKVNPQPRPAAAASPTPVSPSPPQPSPKADWPASKASAPSGPSVERPLTAPPAHSAAPAQRGPGSSGPAPRPVAGASRTQLSMVIPMPSGAPLHSGLKASFVNFPMLLKTLSQDGFSGYVSIRGEKDPHSIGHILLREGTILQAQQRSGGSYRRAKTAIQEVMRGVASGEGLIDAIELPGELIGSLSGLVVANTLFYQLPSRIVDFGALLEFIEEQPLTGGILVSSGSDQVSVVLVTAGQAKGSYSSLNPEMTDGAGVGAAACAEREARIDVVSSPAGPDPVIELSEIG
jgi:hypothetical protein